MGIVNATLLVKSEVFSVKLRKSLQVLERSAHGCQTSVKLEETSCSPDFSKLFLHHLTAGCAPTHKIILFSCSYENYMMKQY